VSRIDRFCVGDFALTRSPLAPSSSLSLCALTRSLAHSPLPLRGGASPLAEAAPHDVGNHAAWLLRRAGVDVLVKERGRERERERERERGERDRDRDRDRETEREERERRRRRERERERERSERERERDQREIRERERGRLFDPRDEDRRQSAASASPAEPWS
jgi:hypothetical protein